MFEFITRVVLNLLSKFDDPLPIIGVFTSLLFFIFFISFGLIIKQRAIVFCRSAPTLLTTIGIVGTFLGISTGLLHFNTSDLETSIFLLLNGLKLAFITSITGIALAVLLRLGLIFGLETRNTNSEKIIDSEQAINPIKLLERQVQIADLQLTTNSQLITELKQLDSNLTSLLKNQHQQQLEAFQNFAEQLSELGSRQLIIALESVIRDFNNNLGSQFGENFRKLDTSVEKLLRWQEQYRSHLEMLEQQLDHATASVAASAASLQGLTQQARQISRHLEDQEATLSALRREEMELEAVLAGIAELREKAQTAFPFIDQRLKSMLENIENAVLAAINTQQRVKQYSNELKV